MHESAPAVSVVIPTYNGARCIRRALDSILAQTYPNVAEIIVVDDGSTDDTESLIRAEYPDVLFLKQENAGPAVARNYGVTQASSDFLAFLDADDQWLKTKLELQMRELLARPQVGLITCDGVVQRTDHGEPPEELSAPAADTQAEVRPVTFDQIFSRTTFPWGHMCPSSWLVRKELWDKHGGMSRRPDIISKDYEFLLRVTAEDGAVASLLLPLFRYFLFYSSLSNSLVGRRRSGTSAVSIITDYDPQGADASHGQVTQEQYDEELRRLHFNYGVELWALGDRELGRDYLKQAAARAGSATPRERLSIAAAAACPHLFLLPRTVAQRLARAWRSRACSPYPPQSGTDA